MVPTGSGGATEATAPEPIGEYASACRARGSLNFTSPKTAPP